MKNLKLLTTEIVITLVWLVLAIACPALLITAYGFTLAGLVAAAAFLAFGAGEVVISTIDLVKKYRAYKESDING